MCLVCLLAGAFLFITLVSSSGAPQEVVIDLRTYMPKFPWRTEARTKIIELELKRLLVGTTTQIGENTFVHNNIVYRIIDNEITELGSLQSDSISRSMVLTPSLKNYGTKDLNYVKNGASADLTAVYRGDILYFNLRVNGLNNLFERYRGGHLIINFNDQYDFQIYTAEISMSELVRILGINNETVRLEYNGKVKMSSEIYRAIENYSVSSSLKEKGNYY